MDGLTLGSTVNDYGLILARSNSLKLNALKMDFFITNTAFHLTRCQLIDFY